MIDVARTVTMEQDELALLSNPEHSACIAEARAAYRSGESIPIEDYLSHCRR